MNNILMRAPDLIYNNIGEDVVILGKDGEELITLNSTAAFIWKLCDGKVSENDVVNMLYEQFSADYETIQNDVHETISLFINKGLLERSNNQGVN